VASTKYQNDRFSRLLVMTFRMAASKARAALVRTF
jgi:hypothetical protein